MLVYRGIRGDLSIKLPADNQKRSIALKLVLLAKKMRQSFDQEVEAIGLSSAKWTLIAVVARRPGATQKTIADLLNVTEVSAGRMVDRLCGDGYLRRSPHPEDRRAYCVFLTDAAQPLLERLGALAEINEQQAFAGISDTDLAQFEKTLAAVEANVDAAKRPQDETQVLQTDNALEPAEQD